MQPLPLSTTERSLRWIALWSVMFGLTGLFSLLVSDARPGQVTIWLANPVGAVALLLLSRKQWPSLLAGMLASLAVAKIFYAWTSETQLPSSVLSVLMDAGLDVPVRLIEVLLSTMMLSRIVALERSGENVAIQAMVLLRAALLPSAVIAPLGGWSWAATLGGEWHLMTLNWFIGSTIGTVAALPLALALHTKKPQLAYQQVFEPVAVFKLFVCLATTLWAGTSLPQPFVFMAAPMVWMASSTKLIASLTANLLIAASMTALIRYGVLLPPPTSSWWGDGLFYVSVLATLLPGLFLAVMSEGQRRALKVLEESEMRAKALYLQTPAMLHSIDAEGHIVQVSKLWLDTLDYTERDVLGRYVTDFMEPSSAIHFKEVVIPAALRNGRCDNVEYQMRRKDGSLCDVIFSAIWEYDEAGKPVISLAVLQDVTEKKRLEARSHLAEHDALTGLPNRVLLQDRLKMLCAHHARHGGIFAVGFLDLDHFKEINDNYGHDAGDALLREVASRLKHNLRAADTVCRVGGDEFVMLLNVVEVEQELEALANKIMLAVAQPCKLGDSPDSPVVEVSGSLGLAAFPANGLDPHTLLTHADQAMYAAKRGGRNRSEIYQDILH